MLGNTACSCVRRFNIKKNSNFSQTYLQIRLNPKENPSKYFVNTNNYVTIVNTNIHMGMQRATKNEDLIEEEKNKGYILLNVNTFCQM